MIEGYHHPENWVSFDVAVKMIEEAKKRGCSVKDLSEEVKTFCEKEGQRE